MDTLEILGTLFPYVDFGLFALGLLIGWNRTWEWLPTFQGVASGFVILLAAALQHAGASPWATFWLFVVLASTFGAGMGLGRFAEIVAKSMRRP